MIFLQLSVLLIYIFIGARVSGIGLGVMGIIVRKITILSPLVTSNQFYWNRMLKT